MQVCSFPQLFLLSTTHCHKTTRSKRMSLVGSSLLLNCAASDAFYYYKPDGTTRRRDILTRQMALSPRSDLQRMQTI